MKWRVEGGIPPIPPSRGLASSEEDLIVQKPARVPPSPLAPTGRRCSLPTPQKAATPQHSSSPVRGRSSSLGSGSGRVRGNLATDSPLGSPSRNVFETVKSSLQSRISIITPGEVISNEGDSEDLNDLMRPISSHSELDDAVQELGLRELGLREDHSPDISVNAPRLDLIPEFNLTTSERMSDTCPIAPSDQESVRDEQGKLSVPAKPSTPWSRFTREPVSFSKANDCFMEETRHKSLVPVKPSTLRSTSTREPPKASKDENFLTPEARHEMKPTVSTRQDGRLSEEGIYPPELPRPSRVSELAQNFEKLSKLSQEYNPSPVRVFLCTY